MRTHRRRGPLSAAVAMLLLTMASAGTIAASSAAAAGSAGSAGSAPSTSSWQESLGQSHADDVDITWTGHALAVRDHAFRPTNANTAGGYGLDTFPAHRLASPTDQVTATLAAQTPAGTRVEQEGRGPDASG
jgi:hypothetical protein